jgi:hypothetical protein
MEPFYNLMCIFNVASLINGRAKKDIIGHLPPEVACLILRYVYSYNALYPAGYLTIYVYNFQKAGRRVAYKLYESGRLLERTVSVRPAPQEQNPQLHKEQQEVL